jgi:hypothetical protein
MEMVELLSTVNEHSGHSSIVGMIPRSMAIARRLIFWYLLTLQNSVMQTVRSANAPWRTIAEKWSLFSLVTISKAEFAIRSATQVRWISTDKLLADLSRLLRQRRKRQTSFAIPSAYFVLELGSSAVGIVIPTRGRCQDASAGYGKEVPCLESQDSGYESWYTRMVSKSPFGT